MMRAPLLKTFSLLLLALAAGAPRTMAQQAVTLVSLTNLWRYDQSGADLTGAFSQPAFNDAAWPSGQGLLGLETSVPYPYPYPILAPLSVGGGRVTYYFRTHFNLPFSPDGVTLTSTNYVDDGAIYYLNGVDVGRLRIAAGPHNASTPAVNVNPEGPASVLTFSAASLLKGDNVLAVEVHQSATTSSDIVFGMTLQAGLPVAGPAMILGQPTSRTVEEGSPTTLGATISGTPPFFFQWFHEGAPVTGATNQYYLISAVTTNDAGAYVLIVSNLLGSATSSNAVLTVTPLPFTIFPITNVWKYEPSGVNLGTAWREPGFDDDAWPAGAGLFYNETAALPGPTNTPLALTAGGQPIVTYYFRTHFNWPDSPLGASLTARVLLDDGAVIYLNGVEAQRIAMPGGTIVSSTLASRAVGDATAFETFSLPTTNLVQGDNVLAVEVHQSATNSSDVVFGLSLGTNYTLSLPDLVIWGPSVSPRLETHFFATNDCEVRECAIAGNRRLMRFNTETRNIGTADLFLGDPAGNPLFVFDPCHGHYHFAAFADYRLFDTNGTEVGIGRKVGFCLEDLDRWDTSASPSAAYTCQFQGIQKGWADIYSSGLPCQYVDVTGLPAGEYVLEMKIDPDNRLTELNETNNITRVPVSITPPCSAMANDSFAGAQNIPYRSATILTTNECATKEAGEPNHVGNPGGHSLWYRWIAPYSGVVTINTTGSSFDTLLGLYQGASVNALTALVANDDNPGGGLTSLITTNVVVNSRYYIAVDGYSGANGSVVLNINPAANDPFSACLALSGVAGTVSGLSSTASRELSEPLHAGASGLRSLWYCWTATNSGPMIFDTLDSRYDTLLAVYTGNNLPTLVPVASDNNSGPNLTSRVMFNAVAGMAYRIAVDGAGGASGICTLNWRPGVSILALTQLPDALGFSVSGAIGDRYLIETSSNLTMWAFWMRATNEAGLVPVLDPGMSGNVQRFYRLRTE